MKLEHAPVPALRPSEYSAALIQVLQWNAQRIRGASVLDVGSGSGIVLASLAVMGARTRPVSTSSRRLSTSARS